MDSGLKILGQAEVRLLPGAELFPEEEKDSGEGRGGHQRGCWGAQEEVET
jgi:hypothetical protein